jgi:hypothetical protein
MAARDPIPKRLKLYQRLSSGGSIMEQVKMRPFRSFHDQGEPRASSEDSLRAHMIGPVSSDVPARQATPITIVERTQRWQRMLRKYQF